LHDKGFEQYVELLTVTHRIDGLALMNIGEADLRRPPLSMLVLGDIKRLALSISKLKVQLRDLVKKKSFVMNNFIFSAASYKRAERVQAENT